MVSRVLSISHDGCLFIFYLVCYVHTNITRKSLPAVEKRKNVYFCACLVSDSVIKIMLTYESAMSCSELNSLNL